MIRRRLSRRWLGAGLAIMLVVGSAAPTPAAAAANDPLLDFGWTWPPGFTGTWRFGSFPTTSWMRTAVTNAASHTRYRNPDFEYTTRTSANVTVEYRDGGTSCAGKIGWVGCAKTGLNSPFTT